MGIPAWQTPFVIISFISIGVYVVVIARITTTKKHSQILKGSFFRLIQSQAVAEWILFIEFMVLYRGRKYGYLDGLFKEKSAAWDYVPRFSTFIHYYLKIVIYIGQCYISVNRLTAIFRPTNYEKMWTTKSIWVLRLLQYLPPLTVTAPIAFNSQFQIVYEYNVSQQSLRLIQDSTSTNIVAYIDGSLSLVASLICAISYIATLIKSSKDMLKYGIEKRRLIEIKLLFCGISLFIILLLNTAKQAITCMGTLFATNYLVLLSYDLSYPMIDLIYSVTPWALILSSTAVQELIFPWLKPKNIVSSGQIFTTKATTLQK